MIGQIRSYISYIDENSDNDYINRINGMIDSLPDSNEKLNVMSELATKLNQVNIIKKYKKPVIKVEEQHIINEVPIEVPKDNFDDEINKRIKEYQEFNSTKKEIAKTNNQLPLVMISPYNIARIGSTKVLLYRIDPNKNENETEKGRQKIKQNNGMPSLDIINDEAA